MTERCTAQDEGVAFAQEETLVLFSGGKDSFLAAAQEVVDGWRAILIAFDGGGLKEHIMLRFCANRLSETFGRDKVQYVGCYGTAGIISTLNRYWLTSSLTELGERYPRMNHCQAQCLHCQTAMWVAAIAYAKAKGIRRIACGYKKSDEFCTGVKDYLSRVRTIAGDYGIEVVSPVYDIASDLERDKRIGEMGFEPTACEPRCVLGQPPAKDQDPEWHQDMLKYFDARILNQMKNCIDGLISVFQHISHLQDVPYTGLGDLPPFFSDSYVASCD